MTSNVFPEDFYTLASILGLPETLQSARDIKDSVTGSTPAVMVRGMRYGALLKTNEIRNTAASRADEERRWEQLGGIIRDSLGQDDG